MAKKKTTKKPVKRTKKPGRKLIKVTSPVKKDEAFFVASEQADEKQIESEVLGKTNKTMIYEYVNEDGEVVYGLAYQGVREAVRIINKEKGSGHRIQISDKNPIFSYEPQHRIEGVEVQVYAVDLEGGGGYWGIKFEPWEKALGYGQTGTTPNRFAKETALSKAERNALYKLLPSDIINTMLKKFEKEDGAIKKIEAPKTIVTKTEPKQSDKHTMYTASLKRVGQIKEDKKALNEALKKIDNMPINGKQRGQIRRKINTYLKKIK